MKIASLFILLVLSSCASIIKGTDQAVSFTSEPEGAQVYIDGQVMGRTPLTVTLKKNKYSNVMYKLKGYNSQSKPITKKYDGTAIINIFWDSSTTDAITGAIYEYEPNRYHAILSKKSK